MPEQTRKKSFADILSENKVPDQAAVQAVIGSVNLRKDTRHMETFVPEKPEAKKEEVKNTFPSEPVKMMESPPSIPEKMTITPEPESEPEPAQAPAPKAQTPRQGIERRAEKREEKQEKPKQVFELIDIAFKYSLDIDNTLDDLIIKMRRENPDKKKSFFTKKKLIIMGIREIFRKNGMDTTKIDEFIKEGLR